jgi:hypothetical protein
MNFDRLKPIIPWLPVIALGVAIYLFVSAQNRAAHAEDELSKAQERERLLKASLIVEIEKSKKDLEREKNELVGSNATLKDEVGRLAKALGEKPKVIEVEKLITKETIIKVPVEGAPRPCDNGVQCMMAVGDSGIVKVEKLTFKTGEGNRVVVGTAEVFRTKPEPLTSLFIAPFSAPAPNSSVLEEPPAKRWGAGLYAGFSKDGWAVGPAIAFPPLHVWQSQLELVTSVGLGPGGQFQGGASGVMRW